MFFGSDRKEGLFLYAALLSYAAGVLLSSASVWHEATRAARFVFLIVLGYLSIAAGSIAWRIWDSRNSSEYLTEEENEDGLE